MRAYHYSGVIGFSQTLDASNLDSPTCAAVDGGTCSGRAASSSARLAASSGAPAPQAAAASAVQGMTMAQRLAMQRDTQPALAEGCQAELDAALARARATGSRWARHGL